MTLQKTRFLSPMLGPGYVFNGPIEFFDDFLVGCVEDGQKFSRTADKGDWLLTDDVDASIVIKDDEPGGVLIITTGSNGDDFASCQLNGEAFKPVKGSEIIFGIRMKLADSDDTQWFVGLATTDVAGTTNGPILDGVTESIGFRQSTDTGESIFALIEDNSTESTTDTTIDVANDTFVVLTFVLKVKEDGTGTCEFFVDGVKRHTATSNIPLDDAMTLTMEVHSPTASSTLEVDWIYCGQTRP